MKYNVGDFMFTKKPICSIKQNEQVIITKVIKVGRKTKVDIKDVSGNSAKNVSVKKLRRKRR